MIIYNLGEALTTSIKYFWGRFFCKNTPPPVYRLKNDLKT